jgi:hypothetical protein
MVSLPASGWSKAGTTMGFSYDGQFVSPNGAARCKRLADELGDYSVMGDVVVWKELFDIVITPERPDLAVLTAGAFASPLLTMSGADGFLMGVVSEASGIGKSTAIMLGQGVWASPKAIGGLNDTATYTFGKAEQLKHLPVYHDEIKGPKQVLNFCEIIFALTGGSGKGRANRLGDPRKKGEFETLCAYAANQSMVAAVKEHHKGTDASTLRMFEMQGLDTPNRETHLTSDVGRRAQSLKYHHGGIGREYATYLGKNYERVAQELVEIDAGINQALKPRTDERFWMRAIATVMTGAIIATREGYCTFPINEMYAFMVAEWRRMRSELITASASLANKNTLLNTLGAFLNDKLPRNTLILDKLWSKAQKPPKQYAKILNEAEQRNDQLH